MARKQDNAEFSFDGIEAVDAEMPGRASREEKPNPLLPLVQASLSQGKGKALPPIPADKQKEADNYLRRAALKLDCGIQISAEKNDDGTVTVYFKAVPEKRNRNYTVDDVRAWAIDQGWNEEQLYPRVPREISNAYREAHGLKVNKIGE